MKTNKKERSVQIFRGEEALTAVWCRLRLRGAALHFGATSCSCGAKAGVVEYEGYFYAYCSVCDGVIVRGRDRDEVFAVWAKEVERVR